MILVTNDDGPNGVGLAALVTLMTGLGIVEVVVPDHDYSGHGRAHQGTAVRLMRESLDAGFPFAIRHATPARLVLAELTKPRPSGEVIDLCVVGINDGVNVGQDVTVSATFCAALEAATLGCLGIAISAQQGFFQEGQTASSRRMAATLRDFISSELLMLRGKPYVVNINLPAEHFGGIELTRISHQTIFPPELSDDAPGGVEIVQRLPASTSVEPDSDIAAVFYRGAISVSIVDFVPSSIPDVLLQPPQQN
jgi:5'/3'-nucleotidase